MLILTVGMQRPSLIRHFLCRSSWQKIAGDREIIANIILTPENRSYPGGV